MQYNYIIFVNVEMELENIGEETGKFFVLPQSQYHHFR